MGITQLGPSPFPCLLLLSLTPPHLCLLLPAFSCISSPYFYPLSLYPPYLYPTLSLSLPPPPLSPSHPCLLSPTFSCILIFYPPSLSCPSLSLYLVAPKLCQSKLCQSTTRLPVEVSRTEVEMRSYLMKTQFLYEFLAEGLRPEVPESHICHTELYRW